MNTKLINSAADVIHRAQSNGRVTAAGLAAALDAAQLLQSPETVAEVRAAALGPDAEAQVHATLALAAATSASAEKTPAPAELMIYRASHDSIVMGLYTTEAAARAHCEQLLSNEHPGGTSLLFDWIGDEDDSEEPHELVAQIDGSDEQPTGYVVTPLTVATGYEPEADA